MENMREYTEDELYLAELIHLCEEWLLQFIQYKKEPSAKLFDKLLHEGLKKTQAIGISEKYAHSPLRLKYLFSLFQLSQLEKFYLILCLMPCYDQRYHQLFSSFPENDHAQLPGCIFAVHVLALESDISAIPHAHEKAAALHEKFQMLFFAGNTEGKLDAAIIHTVLCGAKPSIKGVEIRNAKQNQQELFTELAEQMTAAIKNHKTAEALVLYLQAPPGTGKKTLVGNVMDRLNMSLLYANATTLEQDAGLYAVCRQAVIQHAFICFYALQNDDQIRTVIAVAKRFCNVLFICIEHQNPPILLDCLHLIFPLSYPKGAKARSLWKHYFNGVSLQYPDQLDELAAKFRFTPAQIAGAAQLAKAKLLSCDMLNRHSLMECVYQQVSHSLADNATLLYSNFNWGQLVLAQEEKQMLQAACDQIRLKDTIYGDWGFGELLSYGRGVSMLFAGPPGTGKTMAAQVIARELDLEIYKIDLSQIVSKYIGETEKNLSSLFAEASKNSVILLFDETDALLGKRTEVKDSHDKNANMETAFLLQKMEEYEGITIMTTNYLENIDKAFFRRINYVVHFPFPDVAARQQLWETIFPPKTPIAEPLDYSYLAHQFEIAGGSIKNTAVTAAFLAARQNDGVRMQYILKALRYEMAKQGKILLSEDFGAYDFLLEL